MPSREKLSADDPRVSDPEDSPLTQSPSPRSPFSQKLQARGPAGRDEARKGMPKLTQTLGVTPACFSLYVRIYEDQKVTEATK